MTIGDVPGYNTVKLSFRLLETLVRENKPSWNAVLCHVSGIYLIRDTSDGRLYVGSAYGEDGLWSRWMTYTKTGDGGNIELKALLKKKGQDHVEKFQFSILRNV